MNEPGTRLAFPRASSVAALVTRSQCQPMLQQARNVAHDETKSCCVIAGARRGQRSIRTEEHLPEHGLSLHDGPYLWLATLPVHHCRTDDEAAEPFLPRPSNLPRLQPKLLLTVHMMLAGDRSLRVFPLFDHRRPISAARSRLSGPWSSPSPLGSLDLLTVPLCVSFQSTR